MFDFNLVVQEAEKVAKFWSFSQNWFDILSLVLTLLSLWLAFWLGERGYRRDKKDKIKEEKELINSEIKLFKNNLKQLLKAIDGQLKGLKKYQNDKNFSLEFHANVQVDFLKFIDVKHVYEYFGFKNKETIDKVNKLFSNLFALNDFRDSLRDSVRTYISRYTDFEKGFYLYRKLMYKMMHEIANERAIDIRPEVGGYQINFGTNQFAQQFFRLNQSVLNHPDLQDANGMVIRPKLIELFIMPAIELSKQFIPANHDAIQVSDVANEVNSSWINMEVVTKAHFNEIDAHIDTLEKVKEKINEFLELKKD
ncbi:hypothetical protein [Lacinutrix mariniflava]|uniref:hypothetical protein n=1 Tax=Lacinutrix mariniflava TaxID=342955 RepID=UPI0006E2D62D|nr:hypothetical protein [Lacinutrix mariniflava]